MKALEQIQMDMPFLFEYRHQIEADMAKVMADLQVHLDQVPVHSSAEHQKACRRAYAHYHAMMEPIRATYEAINARIAKALAFMPPDPMVISRTAAEEA